MSSPYTFIIHNIFIIINHCCVYKPAKLTGADWATTTGDKSTGFAPKAKYGYVGRSMMHNVLDKIFQILRIIRVTRHTSKFYQNIIAISPILRLVFRKNNVVFICMYNQLGPISKFQFLKHTMYIPLNGMM